MVNFLSRLFRKPKKTLEQIELEISLKKWDDFHWIHTTFISEVIIRCNLNDLAIALIHCDKYIFNRFFKIAKGLFHTKLLITSFGDDLENLLKKHKNVTKEQSDKMKAHIVNNVLHPDYVKYRNIPYGHSPVIG